MTSATVAYFIRRKGKNREVLLGIKTKKVCRNKRIGPGGKRKPRETYEACMVREVAEEMGVHVAESDLQKVACIDFCDAGRPKKVTRVIFFLIPSWRGEFKSDGSLRNVKWFKAKNAPLKKMMLGHSIFFP